jgi:uncharacterized protein
MIAEDHETWQRVPQVARRLVRRLVRTLQPDMIVLFGSYALGRQGPSSDVDLLVVVPDDIAADEVARRRAQLIAGIFPHVDLVPATRAELIHARGERASFLRGVLERGLVVHRAATSASAPPAQIPDTGPGHGD